MKQSRTYLKRNYQKISSLLIFFIFLSFLNNIPYLNLVNASMWYAIVFLIVAAVVLRLSVKLLIILAMCLLIVSFPWLLVGSRVAVENLGVLAFSSLLLAVVKQSYLLRKDR